ncbi:hypothetical protein A0256_12710 [Mucilaginibacter sp. PAMC 26640]|nr:hypothetical protein A0256_12710 [Mucilaginibacter sp. PAMC 26640]
MKEQLLHIRALLQSAPGILAGKKVAAGFDGFVDSIVRVVNNKTEAGAVAYFDTIKDFGDYISGKSGSGFSLESEELIQKLGGNMPIMANAMAQMGLPVACVGAFGLPVHTAFSGMHQDCTLHSFTNPGFTTAMEFTDGKIMLAQMKELNHADWDIIKNALGLATLNAVFAQANLVCLVNWSELDQSNNIWQGLLADVFDRSEYTPARQFFFDLSDCSKRTADVIKMAMDLIRSFGKYGSAVLSLNRNEAGILYKILVADQLPDDLQTIGDQLFSVLGITILIIHTSKISLAWDAGGSYSNQPVFVANPTISTGAGDNFNAGFCIAQLMGMNTEQSLMLANSTSNCYIQTGHSPSLNLLEHYVSELISASL